MDKDFPNGPPNSSSSTDARRARSLSRLNTGNHNIDAQDVALLAQFIAGAGMSSYDLSHMNSMNSTESLLAQEAYPSSSEFDHNLFDHGDMTHTQSPPHLSSDFSWDLFLPQHQGQTHLNQVSQMQRDASAASSSSHPHDGLSSILQNTTPPERPGRPARRRSSVSATALASGSALEPPSELNPAPTELDHALTAEEKRRRNTEASARFRVKKKQRTLNLERTINDLTGRAEDLERQAADLRRENGWLKEIIILKGNRLAVTNLASHFMAESTQRAAEESSSKREDDASDSDSSDAAEASTSKGKGKSRKK
ncbi:hypothetical protein H2248_000488 [Termitomyces sp. 'cryptogamus']|nr:hypothetical protein H2248_000488 [Termitomyces sp. 'cryptogamus']